MSMEVNEMRPSNALFLAALMAAGTSFAPSAEGASGGRGAPPTFATEESLFVPSSSRHSDRHIGNHGHGHGYHRPYSHFPGRHDRDRFYGHGRHDGFHHDRFLHRHHGWYRHDRGYVIPYAPVQVCFRSGDVLVCSRDPGYRRW